MKNLFRYLLGVAGLFTGIYGATKVIVPMMFVGAVLFVAALMYHEITEIFKSKK